MARPIYLNTLSPVHTGNNVERIGNKVDRDKLSNSRCCRVGHGSGPAWVGSVWVVLGHKISVLGGSGTRVGSGPVSKYLINMQFICEKFVDYNS